MAKTLTNERNLRQRQEAIARDLRLLKQMRLVEWGAAALFIAAGFLLKVLGLSAAPRVLFIGGVLVFLALGHEARRREQMAEMAETEQMRGAK